MLDRIIGGVLPGLPKNPLPKLTPVDTPPVDGGTPPSNGGGGSETPPVGDGGTGKTPPVNQPPPEPTPPSPIVDAEKKVLSVDWARRLAVALHEELKVEKMIAEIADPEETPALALLKGEDSAGAVSSALAAYRETEELDSGEQRPSADAA